MGRLGGGFHGRHEADEIAAKRFINRQAWLKICGRFGDIGSMAAGLFGQK
jgi:hypothetical protein